MEKVKVIWGIELVSKLREREHVSVCVCERE